MIPAFIQQNFSNRNSNPLLGAGGIVPDMADSTAREIVAKNVKRLMRETPALKTQAALGKAAGLEQRTIGYLVNPIGDGPKSPKLDTVERVAHAFRLEAWMLLIDSETFGDELTRFLQRPAVSDVRLNESGIRAPTAKPAAVRGKRRKGAKV